MLLQGASLSAQNVIYDNGAPNHVDGNNIAYFIGAEDFTLNSSQTITAVRAWLLGNSGYAGSIAWAIYANSGNSPGAVLASGASPATFTATGFVSNQGAPEYQMDFPITPFTAAASTTYWLGIRNNVPDPENFPTPIPPFQWEWTNPNSSLTSWFYGYGCCGAPTGWYELNYSGVGLDLGAEHAFQLLGGCGPSGSGPCILTPPDGSTPKSQFVALTGSGTPNDTLDVLIGGAPVGSVVVDQEGKWEALPYISRSGPQLPFRFKTRPPLILQTPLPFMPYRPAPFHQGL